MADSVKLPWSQRVENATDPRLPAVPDAIRYDLGQGLPAPESFPRRLLADLTSRVLDEDGPSVLEYFDPRDGESQMVTGPRGLRDAIATITNEREGGDLTADEIMLVAGSMDGLAHIAAAVLDPGDGVVVEAVTYQRPVQVMRNLGARVAAVPLDDDGLDPDHVVDRLRAFRRDGITPKLVYTIPTFHSPLGVTLSAERRRRLLDIAHEWNIHIIEDDVYARLRYEGNDVPAMASMPGGERVLYLDSFSKTIAPALRLAWIRAEPESLRFIEAARTDLGVGRLGAVVMEHFLREGHFEPHLARVNDIYRSKRDTTLAALGHELSAFATWRVPQGSMYFWLTMHDAVDLARVVTRARELGVLVRPGSLFAVEPGSAERALRICFGRLPGADIEPAVALLGQAVRDVTPGLRA